MASRIVRMLFPLPVRPLPLLLAALTLSLALLPAVAGASESTARDRCVIVGVGEFPEDTSIRTLPYAVDDAIDLAHAFAINGGMIDPKNVVLLLGGKVLKRASGVRLEKLEEAGVRIVEATTENIQESVERAAKSGDSASTMALVWISHGLELEGSARLYAWDSRELNRRDTTVSAEEIMSTIDRSPHGRRVLLLDAARVGLSEVWMSRTPAESPSAALQAAAAAHPTLTVSLAARPGEFATDDESALRGRFAGTLIERLAAAAESRSPVGSFEALAHWANATTRTATNMSAAVDASLNTMSRRGLALEPADAIRASAAGHLPSQQAPTTRGITPVRAGDGEGAFSVRDSVGVFVGVSNFPADYTRIPYAVDDAVDLAHLYVEELRLLAASNVVLCLAGTPKKAASQERLNELRDAGVRVEEASAANIYKQCEAQSRLGGPSGLMVLSFATHGVIADGERLLASNSEQKTLHMTSLSMDKLEELLASSRCDRRLMFVDACRERVQTNGDGRRSTGTGAARRSILGKLRDSMSTFHGSAILLGAPDGGFAYDDSVARNGVFTSAVLAGLRGAAEASNDGFVTVETLADYADQHVRGWVAKNPGRRERGGVTLVHDPHHIKAMPLAPHPILHAKYQDYRDRASDVIQAIAPHVDLDVLRGDFAQAIADGLEAANIETLEAALPGLEAITVRKFEGPVALLNWWNREGSSLLPSDTTFLSGEDGQPTQRTKKESGTNNSKATADRLSFDSAVVGSVGAPQNPVDVYSVVAPSDGYGTISLQYGDGPGGGQGRGRGRIDECFVTDLSSSKLALVNVNHFEVGTSRHSPPVAMSKGRTYFLYVYNRQGQSRSYELVTTFNPIQSADPHEATEKQNRIPSIRLGHAVRGKIGFDNDQLDQYTVELDGPGVVRIHLLNTAAEPTVSNGRIKSAVLLDSKGTPVLAANMSHKGPGTDAAQSRAMFVEGTESLRVAVQWDPLQASTYELSVLFEPQDIELDLEPNGTPGQAQSMNIGTDMTGVVGTGTDDVDWFAFTAPRSGTLQLEVTNSLPQDEFQGGSLGTVELSDASGRLLGKVNVSHLGPGQTRPLHNGAVSVQEGARYRIKVRTGRSKGGVSYKLGTSYVDE